MTNPSSVRWIYLAAGDGLIFCKQATLSICSLLAHSEGRARLTIYTDRPQYYAWLASAGVEVEAISPSLLAQWIGPEKFFLRAKPCLLLHHFDRHPEDTAVFFLDSDTLVQANPLPLETSLLAGAIFMHCAEYRVCDNQTKERREYRKRLLDRPLAGGLTLREDSIMWNSGLFGIHRDDLGLVVNALKAVDAMTALGLSPRTRLREQLAFSLAAQATGRLQATDTYFLHYWGNKVAWERWTDAWLLLVLNARCDPIEAGRIILDLGPPPAPVAPRKSRSERRKAKWRKLLGLN